MKAPRRALLTALLAAALVIGCSKAPPPPATTPTTTATTPTTTTTTTTAQPPPPAPVPSDDVLVAGPLPAGPNGELARASCTMCHSEDYLVQQRLSPEGWKKTLAKMQKFGAPVNDAQAADLAAWLASMYRPALAPRVARVGAAPAMLLE